MINYYKSVTSSSKVLGQLSAQEFLKKIKEGDENIENIELAREYYFDDAVKYVNIKKNLLPCFSLNFTFDNIRRNCNIIGSTGCIYIDIDDSIDIDLSNPLIYSTWISLSGFGRGTLVKVENLTRENFSINYELISKELGVESDNGAKKISQVNVLSYDPNIYINNSSDVWIAKDLSLTDKEKTHYSIKIKTTNTIATVMGSNMPLLRFDNLDELIENVEFNGDVIHDYRTKITYSKVMIPFNGIPIGKRNSTITAITYQQRALNPLIEKSFLFRIINKINRKSCEVPLPVNEIDSIVKHVMNIENIVPIENANRRFVFNKDYGLTSTEKRQEVMKILNSDRTSKSIKNIENAINEWDFNIDGKITQKALSLKIPMNIKTVKKYYPEFKSEIQQLNNEFDSKNKKI